MFCHNCGKKLRDGARFCPECGASMVEPCPKCGAEMLLDEIFCSQCGYQLDESGSTVSNASVQMQITPSAPVQATPIAPAQTVSAVAPMQATSVNPVQPTPNGLGQAASAESVVPAAGIPGKEKTQSITEDGQMVIVGGRQIWKARITEIPTEIKIERPSGTQGTKKIYAETFYKYSFKLVDVQDENGKPSVKNVRKAKKSVKTSFATDEITGIFFKTCPVFYLSDVLRIMFMVIAILLLCGYDRWYSYLCTLVVVGVFLFMTRCRQLQIHLKGGTVVKIPLKQNADAAVFLQTIGFSAKADQAVQGRISEASWRARTLAVNYLLILLAGAVVGVGIDMRMEDNSTYTASESMSAEEREALEYVQNYEYDNSETALQDVLEHALGEGEWESYVGEDDSGKEVYAVTFWVDEDNVVQFQLSEEDMEKGSLGNFYIQIEGELIRNAADFKEWLESIYIDYLLDAWGVEDIEDIED